MVKKDVLHPYCGSNQTFKYVQQYCMWYYSLCPLKKTPRSLQHSFSDANIENDECQMVNTILSSVLNLSHVNPQSYYQHLLERNMVYWTAINNQSEKTKLN